MSRLVVSIGGLALAATAITVPALAEEDPAKKTQTAKTFWGVSAEKLEYRYSDSDEELAVIEGDAI
jgi:copper resistance protein B